MISLCKVPKEGSNTHYILQTEWENDSFYVVIYENGISWLGNVPVIEIDHLSQELKMNRDEYIKETKDILTRDGGDDQFSYLIENEEFIWKKRVPSRDILLKFGYVKLETAPLNGVVTDMFDILLDKNSKLHQETQDLMIKNGTLELEKNNLKKKLETLIEEKKAMEETLYSKFLAILNAKKEKIVILGNQDQEGTTSGVPQRAHVVGSDSDTPDDLGDTLHCRPRIKSKPAGRGRTKVKSNITKPTSNPVPKRQPQTMKDNEANPTTSQTVESLSSSDSNHYNSDTDIDDMVPYVSGKEITSNSSPVTKRKSNSNLFEDDSSGKTSLPKRTKPNANNYCDSIATCKTLTTTNTRTQNITPLPEAGGKFNTQDLLDEI